jgi:hypothetical protein
MSESKKIKNEIHNDDYVKPLSFLQMVREFKKTAIQFIKDGAQIVEPPIYTNRLGTCNECEHLIRKSMRCGACGCLLEAKAGMKNSYCPLGKWENGMQKKDDKE